MFLRTSCSSGVAGCCGSSMSSDMPSSALPCSSSSGDLAGLLGCSGSAAASLSASVNARITTTFANTAISFKWKLYKSARVEVCGEAVVSISCVPQMPKESPTIVDSLGRPHFKTPHTGPATIALRSSIFHSSTSEIHTVT